MELGWMLRDFIYPYWFFCFLAWSLISDAGSPIVANLTISYQWPSLMDAGDDSKDNAGSTDRLFASIEIVKHFNWQHDINEHIILEHPLTVDEAYNGKTVHVAIDRRILNKNCRPVTCPRCHGSRYIVLNPLGSSTVLTRTNRSDHYNLQLLSPCPTCTALGFIAPQHCALYDVSSERLLVEIPPGAYSGYTHVIKGKGNFVYKDRTDILGDFKFTVKEVGDGSFMTFTETKSVLSLQMSAFDMVNGFFVTMELVKGKIAEVDRRDMVTLPGEKLVIPGLGLPVMHSNPKAFRDLDVHVDLIPEAQECLHLQQQQGSIIISSQEDVDKLMAFQNCQRKSALIRSVLTLMKAQDDSADTDSNSESTVG